MRKPVLSRCLTFAPATVCSIVGVSFFGDAPFDRRQCGSDHAKTKQVLDRFDSAIFGQKLMIFQVDGDVLNARAILHRRADLLRKNTPGEMTTMRTWVRFVSNDMVGVFDLAQRVPLMPLLPLLPAGFFAPLPRRLVVRTFFFRPSLDDGFELLELSSFSCRSSSATRSCNARIRSPCTAMILGNFSMS